MSGRDSGKALVVSLLLVLAFVAFAYGWFYYQEQQVVQERRSKALRSAEIELDAQPMKRESAGLALRQVQKVIAADQSLDDGEPPADELIRQQTRLQLALGKTAAAWDGIEAYVISSDAQPVDLWLGTLASSALYAQRGNSSSEISEEGLRALGMARRHHQATGELKSIFMAVTLAYRLGEVTDFCELREVLLREHGDTREGRLLTILGYSMGVHLSERIGFAGDKESLEEPVAAGGEGEHALLARLRSSAARDSAAGDVATLEDLADEFETVPAELHVAIAEALVGRPGAQVEALQAGMRRLEQGLEEFPSCLEARHFAAVIHYALSIGASSQGDRALAKRERSLCQGQLRWLLKNAAQSDLRRANWRAMQG